MRGKQAIMQDLISHAQHLDPQHYELASVAMVETEVQVDIRDELTAIKETLRDLKTTVSQMP